MIPNDRQDGHGEQLPNVNETDREGLTPLYLAERWGAVSLCKALVTAGARLDAKDQLGETPQKTQRSM